MNLTANTDLRIRGRIQAAGGSRKQDGAIVRLEDIGDVVLGAEDYDAEVRFSMGKRPFLWGSGRFPTPIHWM